MLRLGSRHSFLSAGAADAAVASTTALVAVQLVGRDRPVEQDDVEEGTLEDDLLVAHAEVLHDSTHDCPGAVVWLGSVIVVAWRRKMIEVKKKFALKEVVT